MPIALANPMTHQSDPGVDSRLQGYSWVMIWYVIFVFNQVYIKFVVDSVDM